MPETYPPCAECGIPPRGGHVLIGWSPCYCGGHRTVYCRADAGGCGTTRYLPPLDPERCSAVRFGWSAPDPYDT